MNEITDGEMNAMKTLLRMMSENGCFISENNAGYSYFMQGSGITKGMGAEGLIRHLVRPHDLAHTFKLDDIGEG